MDQGYLQKNRTSIGIVSTGSLPKSIEAIECPLPQLGAPIGNGEQEDSPIACMAMQTYTK
jgi:hypothetical protein